MALAVRGAEALMAREDYSLDGATAQHRSPEGDGEGPFIHVADIRITRRETSVRLLRKRILTVGTL